MHNNNKNEDEVITVEQEEDYNYTAFDAEIQQVLRNTLLDETEKCYLIISRAAKYLYNNASEFESRQFTVETQENTSSNEAVYVVKGVKVKADKKKKKVKFKNILTGLVAPSIGAVISVFVRKWCFPV